MEYLFTIAHIVYSTRATYAVCPNFYQLTAVTSL